MLSRKTFLVFGNYFLYFIGNILEDWVLMVSSPSILIAIFPSPILHRNPMLQSHVIPLLSHCQCPTQGLGLSWGLLPLYNLSYCPMWEWWGQSCGLPQVPRTHCYPTCPSYPTLLCGNGGDSPVDSHEYHTHTLSYVSILSHSPMWEWWGQSCGLKGVDNFFQLGGLSIFVVF